MTTSRIALITVLTGIAVSFPAPALANDPVAEILACRTVEAADARLACFEAAAHALAVATSSGDIVTVMREDIEAVEGDSFGFSMPSLPRIRMPLLAMRAEADRRATETLTAPAPAQPAEAAVEMAVAQPAAPAAATSQEVPAPVAPVAGPVAPSVEILERGNDGNVNRVMVRIARTRVVGYNTTLFYMENGQVWRQKDDRNVRLPRDRENMTAEIRRGALGSFLLRINGSGRAIVVERQE